MPTIAELKKHLEGYKDGTPCAYALWLPDDVTAVAPQLKKKPDQVAEVLDEVHRRHDANNGITWDTLKFYASNT